MRYRIACIGALVILLFLSSVCHALPSPAGKITKADAIEKFFSNRELDFIEGMWTTANGIYEIAIVKNSFGIYPEYDYLGLVIYNTTGIWKPGELKLAFKKTATDQVYTGLWYGYGAFGASRKYGCAYLIYNHDIIQCAIEEIGKDLLIRQYPTDKSSSGPKQSSSGTGFFISSNLVATNYHVVEDAKRLEVTFQGDRKFPATMVAKDPSNDLALLKVTGLEAEVVPVAVGSVRDSKEGNPVYTVGFPMPGELGTRAKIGEGIITSTGGIQDDIRMFQVSIPIQPGNSGGPLFNVRGQVIGITTASLNNKYFLLKKGVVPQNVNFALKINYINNLLNSLPEEVKLSESGSASPLDATQIMEIGKTAVVYITATR